MNGSGCIFDHYGRIPESAYTTNVFNSPLEEAVYKNDLDKFKELVKAGHAVSVQLKIGEMPCIEFAAMKGNLDMLRALIEYSINATTLQEYFSLNDVVERAYMISKNKDLFFGQQALAEANRYEAALFMAIMFNHPKCVDAMINYGVREPQKHCFFTSEEEYEKMSVKELAGLRGHTACLDILRKRLPHIP